MAHADITYRRMLQHILSEGNDRGDRTGTGTRGVFGYQNSYDLAEFPLLTSKKMFFKGIVHELLWMIAGRTDVAYLQEEGVKIWDDWATAEQCAKFGRAPGDLGPVYGHQWRRFGERLVETGSHDPDEESMIKIPGTDQLKWVVEEIQKNPNSRRLIVSAWNPEEQGQVALPPCHTLFQFYVRETRTADPDNVSGHHGEDIAWKTTRYLDCQLYQRSADVFLGVPFNIASYALLTSMVAHVTGLTPGRFVHTFGDLHIYQNHKDQVNEQIDRPNIFPAPTLRLSPELAGKGFEGLLDFKFADIELHGYQSHPGIKAPIAV